MCEAVKKWVKAVETLDMKNVIRLLAEVIDAGVDLIAAEKEAEGK